MAESSPLQCQCGVTAFADIRFIEGGKLALTCFHCRTRVQVSVSAMMERREDSNPLVSLAKLSAEREAPEPSTAPDCPRCRSNCGTHVASLQVGGFGVWGCYNCGWHWDGKLHVEVVKPTPEIESEIESEPEPAKPTGYKYSGLL